MFEGVTIAVDGMLSQDTGLFLKISSVVVGEAGVLFFT